MTNYKTFLHAERGSASAAWRCSLDLPHSFTPCDGRRLEVTGYGKTNKEASEVVCRRAMAVLLMTSPGDVVLRPPHWWISPSSLVKGLPGTDTAHQALQSLRRRRQRKEYDRQRHGPPGDRDLTLYFSEINGETCAGPWHFPPNLRIKTIQQRLEDETFSSRCFDKHTEERLAFVRILTSCGVVLDESHCLIECSVRDGDTLTVVVVEYDDQEIRSESPGEVMVP